MQSVLLVGLGGFVGAALRYGFMFIPIDTGYPLKTAIINFLGALAIGMVTELSQERLLGADLVLFLRPGLCGGFTTFSTFSLEMATLWQEGKYLMSIAYSVQSVACCLVGVFLGLWLAQALRARLPGL